MRKPDMTNPEIRRFHEEIDKRMEWWDKGERAGLESGVMLGLAIALALVGAYAFIFLGLR